MAESKEELKSHYMKVKEESESIGLKFSFQKTKIMASGPISPWQIDAETMKTVSDLFSWVPKSLQMVTVATKVKDTCSFEEKLWKTYRHCFANKNLYSQSYVFSSSHAWMWELNHKESWAPKNGYFWTVVLQKTLKSPLDCKEIKGVNHKGNQSQIFIGRTDAEAEAPILCPPGEKSWFPVFEWRGKRSFRKHISSSAIPFSSCLQSLPASGSFPMSQFFVSGAQCIGA